MIYMIIGAVVSLFLTVTSYGNITYTWVNHGDIQEAIRFALIPHMLVWVLVKN